VGVGCRRVALAPPARAAMGRGADRSCAIESRVDPHVGLDVVIPLKNLGRHVYRRPGALCEPLRSGRVRRARAGRGPFAQRGACEHATEPESTSRTPRRLRPRGDAPPSQRAASSRPLPLRGEAPPPRQRGDLRLAQGTASSRGRWRPARA
jgi:hypothetical protein